MGRQGTGRVDRPAPAEARARGMNIGGACDVRADRGPTVTEGMHTHPHARHPERGVYYAGVTGFEP